MTRTRRPHSLLPCLPCLPCLPLLPCLPCLPCLPRRPYLPWLVCLVLPVILLVGGCRGGCGKRFAGVDRGDGKIPAIRAPKVRAGAIRVDGRLDEAAWKRAGRTGPFVHPGNGQEPRRSPVKAKARIAWDDRALYVGCTVHDADPTSPFARDAPDPHIWARSSGVELMIQPGDPGSNRHYYEVQVDVKGAVWDTRFDDYNLPRSRSRGGTRFGHQSWSSGMERAIVVERARGRYTVELALPWRSLRPGPGQRTAIPPRPGDTWRINLYSFRDGQRAALAWSPILGLGNFHRTSRFGRVVFAGPG